MTGIQTHTLLNRSTRAWVWCSYPLGHDTPVKFCTSIMSIKYSKVNNIGNNKNIKVLCSARIYLTRYLRRLEYTNFQVIEVIPNYVAPYKGSQGAMVDGRAPLRWPFSDTCISKLFSPYFNQPADAFHLSNHMESSLVLVSCLLFTHSAADPLIQLIIRAKKPPPVRLVYMGGLSWRALLVSWMSGSSALCMKGKQGMSCLAPRLGLAVLDLGYITVLQRACH